MILGIDLDGVLYDWHDALHVYYQYMMGYEGTFREFWLNYIPSLSAEKQDYLVNLPIIYDTKVPSKDITDFLDFVRDNVEEVYYITKRPLEIERVTRRYLRRYNFPFQDNLIITGDKASACRLYGVTHFLDDFASHVEAVKGIAEVYLMAKPWNEQYQDQYNTVHSLREFKERVFG